MRHEASGLSPGAFVFGIAHSIPEGLFGENKSFMEDIVGWAKQTDRLYLWDYVTQFTHYPHEITPVDWTAYMDFAARHGNGLPIVQIKFVANRRPRI